MIVESETTRSLTKSENQMNKTQALRKAVKLFGKNAIVTDYGVTCQSSPEARKAASNELKALREKCTTPELRAANNKERSRLAHEASHYRFSVGVVVMGMFNSIKACGDSWDGCFKAIEREPEKGTCYE
jgi:hypothetical protein